MKHISYMHTPSVSVDLDLHICGYDDCASTFSFGPFIRDCYLIHFVVKGSGYYEYANKRCLVSAGELFIIFPGEVTYYESESSDPWSFYFFAFSGKRSMELLQRAGITKVKRIKEIPTGSAFAELIAELIDITQTEVRLTSSRIQGYLYFLLSALEIAHQSTNISIPAISVAHHMERAVQYIDYYYMEPLIISKIANYIGLERTYFSKQFRKFTGKSPQNFIMHFRIEKSIQLMRSSSLSLSQISILVGFQGEYYYSRVFKKLIGQAPKDYRKQDIMLRSLTPFDS